MKYIARNIEKELRAWQLSSEHKPLLLRGARQVGKTTTIRNFAKNFRIFVEVNFEQQEDAKAVFSGNLEPKRICQDLAVLFNTPIVEGETLLFLDEIQTCLPAISSLRFFFEQMPQLHVIAAGSLLEFALAEIPSFGVGRIDSMFMYPMSFGEFLEANNAGMLREAIQKSSPVNPLSEALHQKALDLLKRFMIIGGMPNVVSSYAEKGDLLLCQKLLDGLINSYEDDFAKYRKRITPALLKTVFRSAVNQNGNKFVIAKATQDINNQQVKIGLELLTLAGLLIPVTESAGNGIPLGAEVNPKKKKYLVFDTGIFQRINRLEIADILLKNDFEVVNKGAIAELFAGLELVKSASCYERQELFYWHREAKNSNAEVDYLIQKQGQIVPIEVKSGKKGSMQSLYLFLDSKKINTGVRTSLENFGEMDRINIYPLYAIGPLVR